MAPDKRGVVVVFSWSPEGRSLISVTPETPAQPPPMASPRDECRTRLRRLNGWITDLVLLAIAGFALGYAIRLLPQA